MAENLVIGIGNVVLSDDGVGPYVARKAEEVLSDLKESVDFRENYSGGFDLLYELTGYERVLIIDSIMTGKCEPGTCLTFTTENFDELTQERLVDSHGVNLPTILEAGRRCGYSMPSEILIFGIESEDVTTFSEKLTEKVEASIDNIIEQIRETLLDWMKKDNIKQKKK